mmetsp:Transcript_27541/g.88980  ORF Transcript_27541/g.88980 Transcript_27541/m.88980 type:complete len:331 (+) Transcript_27541:3-995(+)
MESSKHQQRRCAHCGKEEATLACARCKTPYCDKKCQKRGWKVHKEFCGDEKTRTQIEHAVYRAMAQARSREPPVDARCFICLEGPAKVEWQGCGCRGSAGFAHVECLAEYCRERRDFRKCPTCLQDFSGRMAIAMKRAFWRSARGQAAAEQFASFELSRCLHDAKEYDAMRLLQDVAERGLAADAPARLMNRVDRARMLRELGRADEALELMEDTITRVRLSCNADSLSVASVVMASVLDQLGRQREALPFIEEAVAIAETSFGPDAARTHHAKGIYAYLLSRNDRPDEAREIFQHLVTVGNRLYGPDHHYTVASQHAMHQFAPTDGLTD